MIDWLIEWMKQTDRRTDRQTSENWEVHRVCDRPVREDLADKRREESGEEEDDRQRENTQPRVQRNVCVCRHLRSHSPGVASRQRHGLRPHGSQRAHRTAGARRKERTNRDEALEWDVREATAICGPVAHTQALGMNKAHVTDCDQSEGSSRRHSMTANAAFTPDTCSRTQVSRTSNLYPSIHVDGYKF